MIALALLLALGFACGFSYGYYRGRESGKRDGGTAALKQMLRRIRAREEKLKQDSPPEMVVLFQCPCGYETKGYPGQMCRAVFEHKCPKCGIEHSIE